MDKAWNMIRLGMIGDALGARVEFLDEKKMTKFLGEDGLVDTIHGAFGDWAAITDDTQMTLFTLEAMTFWDRKDLKGLSQEMFDAYRRWYETQKIFGKFNHYTKKWELPAVIKLPSGFKYSKGILARAESMYTRRAPGMTCLNALSGEKMMMLPSKGSGGVMRAAPLAMIEDYSFAMQAARMSAELTHSHVDGWLSAQLHVALLHRLLHKDMELSAAVTEVLDEMSDYRQTDSYQKLAKAQAIGDHVKGVDARNYIYMVGEGWTGDEALAVAVMCALAGDTPEQAMGLAVTHKGDSDTTGSICGELLGAQGLEVSWKIMARDTQLAKELYDMWQENRQGPRAEYVFEPDDQPYEAESRTRPFGFI